MKKEIDLIIAVYNAYNELKECMSSVFDTLPEKGVRIILIEDSSTDERVLPLLEKYAQKENVQLLKNDKNEGFVKSVNKGMKLYNDRDVLHLNVDTIVTEGWVEKIQECAYSRDNVATVTPLTNNGDGICSVPNFNKENEVPEDYTVQEFAELIEKHSLKLYPEIPTAVGFCMYIRKDALDKVGFFDEETFGRGYGEETDFSLRAKKDGYINLLDDQTYIYHKGGSSFTSEVANDLSNKGLDLLLKKHPDYLDKREQFIRMNPLKPIHTNIYFWIKYERSNLPNPIIHLLHNIYKIKAGLF